MTDDQVIKVVGVFLNHIVWNIGVWRLVLSDTLKNKKIIVIGINLLLFLGEAAVIWFTCASTIWLIGLFGFTIGLTIFILYSFGKSSDLDEIDYNEMILDFGYVIDVNINHIYQEILDDQQTNNSKEIIIKNGLDFILTSALGIIHSKHSLFDQASVFVPNPDFSFTIISSWGIDHRTKQDSENNLKHGNMCNCLAGKAMELKTEIYIPDLSKSRDPMTTFYCQLPNQAEKIGSLSCIPIYKDSDLKEDVIAVINIFNKEPKSFNDDLVQKTITMFSPKIALLVYMLAMIS